MISLTQEPEPQPLSQILILPKTPGPLELASGQAWRCGRPGICSLCEDGGAGVEVRGTKLQLLGTNVSGSELPNNQSENFSYLTLISKEESQYILLVRHLAIVPIGLGEGGLLVLDG